MRAKVLRSFVSNQPRIRASVDDIIEMPEGVDWVRAGLVEILPDEPMPKIDLDELNVPGMDKKYLNKLKKLVEDASLKTPEKAVIREKGKSSQEEASTRESSASKSKTSTKAKRKR